MFDSLPGEDFIIKLIKNAKEKSTMEYSIFRDTLVDMPYPEIEESIKQNACVLLPVSVVEEHGPHLCTGIDIYLTQSLCQKVKQKLEAKDQKVVMAPPFYWGVNSITNGFVGSFSIKPETMTMILLEILENLKKSVDAGEFNSEAAKKIIEISKLAETKVPVGGFKTEEDLKILQKSINDRVQGAGVKSVDEEEALKLNSDYEKKMQEIKEEDTINQQVVTLADIEDMVKLSITDMLSFVTELEDKFKKEIAEANPAVKNLIAKIEELKNKYNTIINN